MCTPNKQNVMINKNTDHDETLSAQVRAFYSWKAPKIHTQNHENFLDKSENFLKWDVINSWLEFNDPNIEDLDQILKCHESCVNRIPAYFQILNEISRKTSFDMDVIEKYTSWTGRVNEIISMMSIDGPKEMIILEQILFYTSLLEFSLANIFFTLNGSNPLHLFKDLLKSPSLNEIFPKSIPFIRYLMGSPVSVNLRNIAWHGFLVTSDCDEVYSKLLLLIVLSLGRDLTSSKNLKINYRNFATQSIEKFDILREKLPSDYQLNKNLYQSESELAHFYDLYEKAEYGRALVVLLIKLETHVRGLFSEANPNFDSRARIDGYYFTLDTIMDLNVCVGGKSFNEINKNNVRQLMSDNALSLFYDCFVSLKGPRIRDRISHGELPLRHVTKNVVDVVGFLYEELTLNPKIVDFSYESHFHPISELQRKISGLEIALDQVRRMEIPENLFSDNRDLPILNFHTIKIRSSEIFRDSEYDQITKFLKFLIQIIENGLEATLNYKNALEIRIEEFKERKLSQPRRKTLLNMLQIREIVIKGFLFCVNEIQRICLDIAVLKFHAFQSSKKLKRMLKLVENLKVQLNIEKNDWKNASISLNEILNTNLNL
uniref:CSON005067 protein n=1 Tax=Culicoides sonorensis TaxID=179676 RepID=A0A336L6Q1_CULSO